MSKVQCKFGWSVERLARLAGLAMVGWTAATGGMALAQGTADSKAAPAADEEDVLVMKGTNLEIRGTIIEETDTKVRIKGVKYGIPFETEYAKSDILTIRRGKKAEGTNTTKTPAAPAANPGDTKTPARETKPEPAAAGDQVRVYYAELKGEFGTDITQTPIRRAIKDAQDNKADVIIFMLENELKMRDGSEVSNDVAGLFDQIFRAEAMTPIFVEEIPKQWPKQPKIVFWVKQAMGGASLLPFVCPNIYMSSDARIGGIGYLTEMINRGDKVVADKQYSLRLGHARGWFIAGGYDPRLLHAMAVRDYVLSAKITGDSIEYFERMADPLKGEILLTDDGAGANVDSMGDRVRSIGNDVLTLDSKTARTLRISKGTADSLDDLMFQLGLDRTGKVIPGRSKQIMEGWSRDVADATKRLQVLWREYNEVTVAEPGGFDERSKARSTQIAKLNQMLELIRRYEEALADQFPEVQIRGLIDRIKFQQMSDRR